MAEDEEVADVRMWGASIIVEGHSNERAGVQHNPVLLPPLTCTAAAVLQGNQISAEGGFTVARDAVQGRHAAPASEFGFLTPNLSTYRYLRQAAQGRAGRGAGVPPAALPPCQHIHELLGSTPCGALSAPGPHPPCRYPYSESHFYCIPTRPGWSRIITCIVGRKDAEVGSKRPFREGSKYMGRTSKATRPKRITRSQPKQGRKLEAKQRSRTSGPTRPVLLLLVTDARPHQVHEQARQPMART